MKESPKERATRKEVLESTQGEGKATLEFAPLTKPPAGLPPSWKQALTDPHPTAAVLDVVWKPIAKQYPKTIAAMRRSLQRVGLLTTAKRSHSLVYLFELEDEGGLSFYRGYLPSAKLPKTASRLPKDFLAVYQVHDGWLDNMEMMGPRRSSEWGPLGQAGPSREFLVTFEGHGPGILGFDLSENPAECHTVWTESEPKRVRNVAKEMDDWIAIQMGEFERSASHKPKQRPKPAVAKKSSRSSKRKAKR